MSQYNFKQNETLNTPSETVTTIAYAGAEEAKRPTHLQLHDALMGVQDLLERSLLEFILLGDTAKAIDDDELPTFKMDKIHLGITKPHLHAAGASIFFNLLKEWHFDYKQEDNKILIDYKGIPVQIDIIQGNYPYFIFPATRFYTITEFKLPNPIKEYLKEQDNVK